MLYLPLRTVYLIALNLLSFVDPHLFLTSVFVSSIILAAVSRRSGIWDGVFAGVLLLVFSFSSSSAVAGVCLREALYVLILWGVMELFLRLHFPSEWVFWSMYILGVLFFVSVHQLDFYFNPFVETFYGNYKLVSFVLFPFLLTVLVYAVASHRLLLPPVRPLYEYRFTPFSFSVFLLFSIIVLRYAFVNDVLFQGLFLVGLVPFFLGLGYIYSKLKERDTSPAGKYILMFLAFLFFPLTALLGLATIFFNSGSS